MGVWRALVCTSPHTEHVEVLRHREKPRVTLSAVEGARSPRPPPTMSRKAKPPPPSKKPPPTAAVQDPALERLRPLVAALSNAGMVELPSACYRFAKFIKTSPGAVKMMAIQRGCVPPLTAALLEERPRTLSNALYGMTELARGFPPAQAAFVEGGSIPYVARLVNHPNGHVQFRALGAIPAMALGCPAAAALFRTAGVADFLLRSALDESLT